MRRRLLELNKGEKYELGKFAATYTTYPYKIVITNDDWESYKIYDYNITNDTFGTVWVDTWGDKAFILCNTNAGDGRLLIVNHRGEILHDLAMPCLYKGGMFIRKGYMYVIDILGTNNSIYPWSETLRNRTTIIRKFYIHTAKIGMQPLSLSTATEIMNRKGMWVINDYGNSYASTVFLYYTITKWGIRPKDGNYNAETHYILLDTNNDLVSDDLVYVEPYLTQSIIISQYHNNYNSYLGAKINQVCTVFEDNSENCHPRAISKTGIAIDRNFNINKDKYENYGGLYPFNGIYILLVSSTKILFHSTGTLLNNYDFDSNTSYLKRYKDEIYKYVSYSPQLTLFYFIYNQSLLKAKFIGNFEILYNSNTINLDTTIDKIVPPRWDSINQASVESAGVIIWAPVLIKNYNIIELQEKYQYAVSIHNHTLVNQYIDMYLFDEILYTINHNNYNKTKGAISIQIDPLSVIDIYFVSWSKSSSVRFDINLPSCFTIVYPLNQHINYIPKLLTQEPTKPQ